MSQKTNRDTGLVAVIMLVTWALPGVFVRFLPDPAIIELAAWRLIPAFAVVATLLFFIPALRHSLKDISAQPIVWLAALCMAIYYATSNVGLRNAPIAFVALLISLAPVWVMIFERLRGKKQTGRELFGVCIAFCGLAICLWPGLSGVDGSITPLGIWGGLISGFLSATFVLVMRKVQNGARYQPVAVSILTFSFGFPMLAISWIFEEPYGVGNLDTNSLWYLLGLGLISTAMPTLCYAILGAKLPAPATALMNLLVPPSAAIAGWFLLGEALSPMVISGGIISLVGVMFVVIKRGQK